MTQSMQIAILLFIVAFIVGFYLIYLWRAKALKAKYEEEIHDLTSRREEVLQQRTEASDKNHHTQLQYEKVHRQMEEKDAAYAKLQDQQAALMENISALEHEKEELQQKIKEEESETLKVRSQIEQLSKELDEINTIQERLDANTQTLSALADKLSDQKALQESYLQEIERLKALRKRFREEAKALEEKIFDTKALLHTITEKISAIEKRFAPVIEKLQKERESLKIKALNYEFAFKEYAEHHGAHPARITDPLIRKLFRMPEDKAAEIESLIHKNEAVKIVDQVVQKLFKKKLPKEER